MLEDSYINWQTVPLTQVWILSGAETSKEDEEKNPKHTWYMHLQDGQSVRL